MFSLHKRSPCTTVDAIRRKVQAEAQPEACPACRVLAACRPGVAQGVYRAASVTGHGLRGWRHQKKEPNLRCLAQGEGPALSILFTLALIHHPTCLFLQGWEWPGIQPATASLVPPQLSAAWF